MLLLDLLCGYVEDECVVGQASGGFGGAGAVAGAGAGDGDGEDVAVVVVEGVFVLLDGAGTFSVVDGQGDGGEAREGVQAGERRVGAQVDVGRSFDGCSGASARGVGDVAAVWCVDRRVWGGADELSEVHSSSSVDRCRVASSCTRRARSGGGSSPCVSQAGGCPLRASAFSSLKRSRSKSMPCWESAQ